MQQALTPNSFLTPDEVAALGFAAVGSGVQVSRFSRIYGASKMRLGDRVRIDDFAILTGAIDIGSHVHIAAYSALFGGAGISLGDFANISSRVSIYSVSDDYSGETMTSPLVPDAYRAIDAAPVRLGRHVIIGAGTVILPGSTAGDGAAVGALSLVKGELHEWSIYHGIPAGRQGDRSRALLALEKRLLEERD